MKTRILFVDDEPAVLDGLRNMLRKQRREWHMEFAQGGEEALRILGKESFDVMVTDLKMPNVNGVKLLSHSKEHHPKMVRIALSGHVESTDFKIVVSISHACLKKPCNPTELKTTIRKLSLLNGGSVE